MTTVSIFCGLSKVYTNHCIRVTGATVLTRMKFSSSEIMAVTGHKSVQSLAIYQKTQDKQKTAMGKVMHQSMMRKEEEIEIPTRCQLAPPPQRLQLPPPPNPGTAIISPSENVGADIVPFEADLNVPDEPTFDLQQLINDVMADE